MNDVRLTFPNGWIKWVKVGVLTVTDASFSGEAGFKSQQGRVHFLADKDDMKVINHYQASLSSHVAGGSLFVASWHGSRRSHSSADCRNAWTSL